MQDRREQRQSVEAAVHDGKQKREIEDDMNC